MGTVRRVLNAFERKFYNLFRCFLRPCMRLRDSTCGPIRRHMGYSRVDRRCSGRSVPLQERTLSNVDQNDGFSSAGRRGAQTYFGAIRMENRRSALSQSRDGQQPWQFGMPLYFGRCFHGPRSNVGSQKFQPGNDHCPRLSRFAHFSREIRQK